MKVQLLTLFKGRYQEILNDFTSYLERKKIEIKDITEIQNLYDLFSSYLIKEKILPSISQTPKNKTFTYILTFEKKTDIKIIKFKTKRGSYYISKDYAKLKCITKGIECLYYIKNQIEIPMQVRRKRKT